jgi:hypothetical protein
MDRRDLDFTTSISMTSDGTPSSQPDQQHHLAGLATLVLLFIVLPQQEEHLLLNYNRTCFFNTVNSNTFDITTYVNGDWHSITGTGLLWNNTANWMQVISGSLSAPGGGGSGYPNAGNPNVHLYATMSTNGSRSVNRLTIYNGAQLTTTSGPCTVQNIMGKNRRYHEYEQFA